MLKLIHSRKDIDSYQLLRVYREDIEKCASGPYDFKRRIEAEQDFYAYLEIFFSDRRAFYSVWAPDGQYVAAMRVEPYKDGFLITGLETAPEERRKGYASSLMSAVLSYLKNSGMVPVYSHVDKNNEASLAVHQQCGFQVLYDHAVYLDGSVLHTSYTLIFQ